MFFNQYFHIFPTYLMSQYEGKGVDSNPRPWMMRLVFCHFAKCQYAKCHIWLIIILNVVMVSFIMLSVMAPFDFTISLFSLYHSLTLSGPHAYYLTYFHIITILINFVFNLAVILNSDKIEVGWQFPELRRLSILNSLDMQPRSLSEHDRKSADIYSCKNPLSQEEYLLGTLVSPMEPML